MEVVMKGQTCERYRGNSTGINYLKHCTGNGDIRCCGGSGAG